jgi:hypothetical protein
MVATITTATSTLGADFLTVAGIGLGVGVSLYALKKGWRLVRSLIG